MNGGLASWTFIGLFILLTEYPVKLDTLFKNKVISLKIFIPTGFLQDGKAYNIFISYFSPLGVLKKISSYLTPGFQLCPCLIWNNLLQWFWYKFWPQKHKKWTDSRTDRYSFVIIILVRSMDLYRRMDMNCLIRTQKDLAKKIILKP